MLQALIFDVDGTLADTEKVHLRAFNQAFSELGMDWHWDLQRYTELLTISGGKERIAHYWKSVSPDIFAIDANAIEQTIAKIHELKSAYYEAAVRDGEVELRNGIVDLFNEAEVAGVQLAIATTTSPVNITTLLRRALGSEWSYRFSVIEDASTAPRKKPNPQVYLQTLARLKLPAHACLAFEDSYNGLTAARAAGLGTIITPTDFTAHHSFDGALICLPDLSGTGLDELKKLHAMFAEQSSALAS
ncbi:MAG: HAD-IA family hydrolase [Burkholderiales bacterium]|nr:HAD-IA family hydrolase [Burkholderiales bacterium]